jgi:murein DD-endopeptidase MepM/ murein hydrolase activator NlpD
MKQSHLTWLTAFITIIIIFLFFQSISVKSYQLACHEKDFKYTQLKAIIPEIEKKIDRIQSDTGVGNANLHEILNNLKTDNFDVNINNAPNDLRKYYLDNFIEQHGLKNYHIIDNNFIFPVEIKNAFVTSEFGWRILDGKPDLHVGIDIANWSSAEIYACGKGKVIDIGWDNGDGNFILIEHKFNGISYHTYYCHLFKINIEKNQYVTQGQFIGIMGNTGYRSRGVHCHLSILQFDGYKWIVLNPVTRSTFNNNYIRGYYYGPAGIIYE